MRNRIDTVMPCGCLCGVSLGPGDPELVTLKALRFLERADVICCPATVDGRGALQSVAIDILCDLGLPEERFRIMALPMSENRKLAEAEYREHFRQIAADCREGKTVALVSIGDAGFYSTVSAMIRLAENEGIPCSLIPGVPAFIAAAASSCIPVALQDDRVRILAMVKHVDEIERALREGGTVVVMKLSTIREYLVSWLAASGHSFLYAEKVGMEGEFITSDIDALRQRPIPYFSLLVCSPYCRPKAGSQNTVTNE